MAPPAKPLSFLGRGWSFPPRVSTATLGTEMEEGDFDIRQSLFVLLSTPQGERVMVPTYGCDLPRFVFADLTAGSAAVLVSRDGRPAGVLTPADLLEFLAHDRSR